jgi:hypothetical protein
MERKAPPTSTAKAIARLMDQSTAEVTAATAEVTAASAEIPVHKAVNEGLDYRWRFQVLR